MKNFLGFLNGFRKLFICIVVVILSTVFLVTKDITGAEWVSVMTVTVPSYFAGNIGEHLTNTVKDFLAKKIKDNG